MYRKFISKALSMILCCTLIGCGVSGCTKDEDKGGSTEVQDGYIIINSSDELDEYAEKYIGKYATLEAANDGSTTTFVSYSDIKETYESNKENMVNAITTAYESFNHDTKESIKTAILTEDCNTLKTLFESNSSNTFLRTVQYATNNFTTTDFKDSDYLVNDVAQYFSQELTYPFKMKEVSLINTILSINTFKVIETNAYCDFIKTLSSESHHSTTDNSNNTSEKKETTYKCSSCGKSVSKSNYNQNTNICTDCEVAQKKAAQEQVEKDLRTCKYCGKRVNKSYTNKYNGCCSEYCLTMVEGEESEKAQSDYHSQHNHCTGCGECLYDDTYGTLCEDCYNKACEDRTNAKESN